MTATPGRKMVDADWLRLRYFKKEEWRHDPAKADWRLVQLMELLRRYAKTPIIIHVCHATEGHSKNSLHYQGQAVDFHFAGDMTPMEQMVNVMSFPFGGVGYYPYWNNPGWHLDIRGAAPKVLWTQAKNGELFYGACALAQAVWAKQQEAA